MTAKSPPRSTLWGQSDFLRLWGAQTVSDFGARITREGLPMMAVMALAATPGQLGLLYAMTSGPALVIGLACGDFVDHAARRPILIATDLVRALILITLPLAAWLGLLSMLQVYVAAALVASASVLFDIADHAYLPGLVGKDLVTDANAKLSITESVAEMGGPALAGILFQWLTAPIAVVVNAGTYIVSAILLARIKTPEPPRDTARKRRGWIDGVVTGARTAWEEPRLRIMLIQTGIGGLFGGFFGALYIAFVLRGLGLNPALLGLGIATGGVGALAGSLLAQPMARWLGVGPAICVSGGLSALGTMIVLLAPTSPTGAMACLVVSQFLGDAFGVVPLILAGSLRQIILPQTLLGRVGATFRALGGGTAVVGALIGGALGGAFGMRATLLAAIAGLLIGPVLGAFSPLWKVKTMPAD
ncbi:MFS transporter [Phenylobacterium sp.]|uniref:MFS transporter n=1 Tax=Phenylobacterium sp. TaxID=1871053 RepID=UPI00374DB9E3